ncbi:MAG: helix-turn-helix domain-containing protein [Clostridiales bacterium]|nr:helix-turn-helix domain-containing protein [Clostridiales bacterium]
MSMGVPITKIAARHGVSRGTIYRYIDNHKKLGKKTVRKSKNNAPISREACPILRTKMLVRALKPL